VISDVFKDRPVTLDEREHNPDVVGHAEAPEVTQPAREFGGSQAPVIGILDENPDLAQKSSSREGFPLTTFLKARRNDELKATSTKSVFQHLAQPVRVTAEFELASTEFLEALLVMAADLGPPLLDQELVEERSDFLLLGEGEVPDLVNQEVKLHGGVSIERRSLGTSGIVRLVHVVIEDNGRSHHRNHTIGL
jgi:hypothetical protein